jgi:DNA-binding Lrp family transcriptional regulator
MTRTDQLRRDLRIAFEFNAGVPQAELAGAYGISERTVRRAIRRAAQSGERTGEAIEELSRRYTELTAAIEDLALARGGADRLAAISEQVPMLRERHELRLALAAFAAPRSIEGPWGTGHL